MVRGGLTRPGMSARPGVSADVTVTRHTTLTLTALRHRGLRVNTSIADVGARDAAYHLRARGLTQLVVVTP